MTQTEGGRAYGWGWGSFLLQFFSLMIFAAAVAFVVIMALDLTPRLARFATDDIARPLQLVIALLWFVTCEGAFLVIIQTLTLFTTRVEVSPDGIQYRSWQYRQQARWSDIERIGIRVTFGFANEVLYLRRSELTGGSLWLALRRMFGMPPTIMFLTGMFGWPEGPLADDIRRYAPQLFPAPAGLSVPGNV